MATNIISDSISGTLEISDKFDYAADVTAIDGTPIFLKPEDEYILNFPQIKNLICLKRFSYDTVGMTGDRYLVQYYRISINGTEWSDWLELRRNITNFPQVDPAIPIDLEIKWIRKGGSTISVIRLLEYKIEGELDRPLIKSGDSQSIPSGKSLVIRPPFIFKIFKISDLEIISSTGIPEGCTIKYRYSQDSTRTWSNWEILNKQNISTKRINPIRFFQIEYLIENNSSTNVEVQDINLIGDFQNVSEDSKKTNLFGIRECCQSNLLGTYDANGNFVPNTTLNQSGGNSCDTSSSGLPQMTTDEKAGLYNPYQQGQAMNLLQKLSNDAQMIFGHRVIYFATDPDNNGQDSIMHEYQLYNVVCEAEIKVSVEGNNFPDSQIVMNQFDLNLFETMQVHITKQQFKEVFGVQRRPSKEDFLYFCDVNRMYQVDHAQQFRNFNNAAVYYKLILKKYTQKANVITENAEIKGKLKELTKNTTINELFGVEDNQQKDAIANKKQLAPLTRELIRLEIKAQIDKELIENSSTIIAKSHYDLSSVDYQTTAVKYLNFDPYVKESNNLTFMCWFNINNYIPGEFYNFYNHFNSDQNIGYSIDLINDEIIIKMNSFTYSFHLTGTPTNDAIALQEETWYSYLVNINQRDRYAEHFIYKRDVDDENTAANLTYTVLRQVYKFKHDITPVTYVAEGFVPRVLGSDMKITNLRLFSEGIPESYHHKILNQYVIGEDSKYLIFADNATTRLYLPKYPLFE
jgi:hypothetical protein